MSKYPQTPADKKTSVVKDQTFDDDDSDEQESSVLSEESESLDLPSRASDTIPIAAPAPEVIECTVRMDMTMGEFEN